MITHLEVNETNNMIEHENLDVRTITLGISLLDCCDSDLDKLNEGLAPGRFSAHFPARFSGAGFFVSAGSLRSH